MHSYVFLSRSKFFSKKIILIFEIIYPFYVYIILSFWVRLSSMVHLKNIEFFILLCVVSWYFYRPFFNLTKCTLTDQNLYRFPAFLIAFFYILSCKNIHLTSCVTLVSFIAYVYLTALTFKEHPIPPNFADKVHLIWYQPSWLGERIRYSHVIKYFVGFILCVFLVFCFIGVQKSFDQDHFLMALLSVYACSNLCLDAFYNLNQTREKKPVSFIGYVITYTSIYLGLEFGLRYYT